MRDKIYYGFATEIICFPGNPWQCTVRINNENDCHPKYTEMKKERIFLGNSEPTEQELKHVIKDVFSLFKKREKRILPEIKTKKGISIELGETNE
jgi:hypothetical protein